MYGYDDGCTKYIPLMLLYAKYLLWRGIKSRSRGINKNVCSSINSNVYIRAAINVFSLIHSVCLCSWTYSVALLRRKWRDAKRKKFRILVIESNSNNTGKWEANHGGVILIERKFWKLAGYDFQSRRELL